MGHRLQGEGTDVCSTSVQTLQAYASHCLLFSSSLFAKYYISTMMTLSNPGSLPVRWLSVQFDPGHSYFGFFYQGQGAAERIFQGGRTVTP